MKKIFKQQNVMVMFMKFSGKVLFAEHYTNCTCFILHRSIDWFTDL